MECESSRDANSQGRIGFAFEGRLAGFGDSVLCAQMGIVFRRRVFFCDHSPSQRPPYPYEVRTQSSAGRPCCNGTSAVLCRRLRRTIQECKAMWGRTASLTSFHTFTRPPRSSGQSMTCLKTPSRRRSRTEGGSRRDRPGLALLQQRGRNLRIRTMR